MLEKMKKWMQRIFRGLLWFVGLMIAILAVWWAYDTIRYGTVEVGVRPKTLLSSTQRAALSEAELRTLLQVEYISQYTHAAFHKIRILSSIHGVEHREIVVVNASPVLSRQGWLTESPEAMAEHHLITLDMAQQYYHALSYFKLDREQGIIHNEWGGAIYVYLDQSTTKGDGKMPRKINVYMFYTPETPRSICEVSPNLICYQYWWQDYFRKS